MTAHVVVIGSINQDISVAADRIPRPGETVLAHGVTRSDGGKGANQAVAAARAGGVRTSMIGCVGNDEAGEQLLAGLRRGGVAVATFAGWRRGSYAGAARESTWPGGRFHPELVGLPWDVAASPARHRTISIQFSCRHQPAWMWIETGGSTWTSDS